MKNFFKRMFGGNAAKGFVFTTRNIARETGNGDRIRRSGSASGSLNESYLDFASVNDYVIQDSTSATGGFVSGTGKKSNKPSDERKLVEPKAVFEEAKSVVPEVSFKDLDKKIEVVKERIAILKEHLKDEHLGDEHRALFYLENRRKYLKTMKKNPLDWAMTTQDAIEDLCKRYKLKVVPLKQYYTMVPQEGIKEMDRYTKAYEAVTGDKPIFELVIKDVPTETKKKDRDPILLANSPLGNFLFVLGAWDDEVAVVDEIIYQGK